MLLVESQFPTQGSNPSSWQWKWGVLTTGPPGNSRHCIYTRQEAMWLVGKHARVLNASLRHLCPSLTLAPSALSQACRNASCPSASFSWCRAISSWSFLSLPWASSFSRWERASISLNCICKSARLFPKTSEGLWILVSGERKDVINVTFCFWCWTQARR